ncbi:MAG: acetylornithine deacetylase [Bacteroidota bacterium]
MTAQDILSALVSFPVFGGDSNLSIIHWIRDYILEQGIMPTLVPNEEGNKASLHCRIGPAVDGGVILSGHTDVVPVEGQEWTTDPFTLTDGGDGKLYGRGSCDMKGFIACCLAALPEMMKAELKRPIYFAFSYDEEIGCLAAPELVEHIKSSYTEKPTYALIGEPSLLQPIVGQKGITVYHTHVNGSAGHSSRIRQEVSAIHESARLILWIENKMNELVAAGHIDDRFSPPHTSLHSGMIQGGIAHNVISDKADFIWDVRNVPMDKVADIRAAFDAHCRTVEEQLRPIFPEFQIATEVHHPPVPPLDTTLDQDIVSWIQQLSGQMELGAVSYAAEAGQFAEGGFQAVICGPGSIEQAHRADEFIAKDQLEKGVEMIGRIIQDLS